MKVLVGFFTTESNANIPDKARISDYEICFGDECLAKNKVKEVFEQEKIEMIPAIYANAAAAGVVTKEAFEYIEHCFVDTVKKHLHELDGIYLHLHGASEVEEIGSGDHHILKEIRKVTGPYMPIFVVCDPHGNLTQEYAESTTLIRSYRESPHTDADDTKQKVAKLLCDFLKKRQNVHSVYRKLPLILGGEQSVSTDEPVLSINKYMDELEKDSRLLSVSWHVGYLRHDCPEAGCGIIVVPATENDFDYANQIVDDLAKYVWDKRHEFHYTGLTQKLEEAIQTALEFNGKPVFITDSGDNVTSGATGWNTTLLQQFTQIKDLKKKILFANICDPKTVAQLADKDINDTVNIQVGVAYDEHSMPISINGTIKAKGDLMGNFWSGQNTVWGHTVTVSLENTPIDVCIATDRNTMCEHHQFVTAGLDWDDYDIIIVKQGYIFPELKEKGKLCIMALTGGATPQDTRLIPFKRIMRPMFPIDEI